MEQAEFVSWSNHLGFITGHTTGKISHTTPAPANTVPILTLQPQ